MTKRGFDNSTRTTLRTPSRYEPGRIDSHIKVKGMIVVLFLGVKIRGLVPLRVLKSKMTSVRGIVLPFRVLTGKI